MAVLLLFLAFILLILDCGTGDTALVAIIKFSFFLELVFLLLLYPKKRIKAIQ